MVLIAQHGKFNINPQFYILERDYFSIFLNSYLTHKLSTTRAKIVESGKRDTPNPNI